MIEATVVLYPTDKNNLQIQLKEWDNFEYVTTVLRERGFKYSGKYTNKRGACVHIYRVKDLVKTETNQARLTDYPELYDGGD